jgi:hypothetical protein
MAYARRRREWGRAVVACMSLHLVDPAAVVLCEDVPPARTEPVRPVDLLQRPLSFLGRSVRMDRVVVTERFGRHVFLVCEDSVVPVPAVAVVSPGAYRRAQVGQPLSIVGVLRYVDDGVAALDRRDLESIRNDLARAGGRVAVFATSIRTPDGTPLIAAPVVQTLRDLNEATAGERAIGERVDLSNLTVIRRIGPRTVLVTDATGAEAMITLSAEQRELRVREGELVAVQGVVRKTPTSVAGWPADVAESMKSRSLYIEATDLEPLG